MRRARHGLVLARPYRFVSVVSNNLFIKRHARARHFACSWVKTADPVFKLGERPLGAATA